MWVGIAAFPLAIDQRSPVEGRHAAAGGGEDRLARSRVPFARLAEPRIEVRFAARDEAELQRRTCLALFRDRQPLQELVGGLRGVRTAGESDERLRVGLARRQARQRAVDSRTSFSSVGDLCLDRIRAGPIVAKN